MLLLLHLQIFCTLRKVWICFGISHQLRFNSLTDIKFPENSGNYQKHFFKARIGLNFLRRNQLK